MKRFYQSRTVGVNFLVVLTVYLLSRFSTSFNTAVCGNTDFILYALASLNIMLRFLTKHPISVVKNIAPLFLLTSLIGCGGASIQIRNDPSPSPMDENYHTMLMKSSCSDFYSMGQAGCSLGAEDDLSKETLMILSPLGGSLLIYSRECGVDRKDYLEAGAVVTFKLSELIPPNTEFCTFSLFTYWEKPKEIKTDVPFRGQSGKFYVRIRPHGSDPATLSWSPQQGVMQSSKGIIFSQFREFVNTDREPIILKIEPTKATENGKFQIWSEYKQIGIKSKPFTGKEILIPRNNILAFKKDSYILAGWAIGVLPEHLDNDFIVAIDVFGYKAPKLAGSIYFTDNEVCYKTEATVSLSLISGIEKASNKIEDCFPKPMEEAVMAFYTNVGRAAYAVIKEGAYTWIQ